MSSLLQALKDGSWITRERMRLVAIGLLAASGLGLIFLAASSDGLNDYQGRPLGTDFSNVYAAGTFVLEGRAAAPFDPPTQYAREQALFGEKTPFYGWHYPPFFLFIAGALALLPFALALVVWQAATLALYLAATRAILFEVWRAPSPRQRGETRGEGAVQNEILSAAPPHPALRADLSPPAGRGGAPHSVIAAHAERREADAGRSEPGRFWLLLALAFPAVFINIGHGHNGFLTAALLAGALVLLDRRPLVAGVLFGLLAYKPQFGLLIPLVLIATGRWRSFAAAAATVLLLAAATTFAFGPAVWPAFLDSMPFTREVVLEQGNTGWHKIQSIFSWVRMWGGPVGLAYAVQAAATVALGAALIWLWRGPAAFPLKAAALCLAAMLATPYSLDYDLMVLAPAIAFLTAHGMAQGFVPWEKSALAFLWLAPLVARSLANAVLLPLGVIAMLVVFVLILRKADLRWPLPALHRRTATG